MKKPQPVRKTGFRELLARLESFNDEREQASRHHVDVSRLAVLQGSHVKVFKVSGVSGVEPLRNADGHASRILSVGVAHVERIQQKGLKSLLKPSENFETQGCAFQPHAQTGPMTSEAWNY